MALKSIIGVIIAVNTNLTCQAFLTIPSSQNFHGVRTHTSKFTRQVEANLNLSKVSSEQSKMPPKHPKMPKPDPNSFVQTEMRKVAMKLHTRDQAPRQGEQEEKGKKFSEWNPSRGGYLQFLVDSRLIYSTFDSIIESDEKLATFRNTKLERTESLNKDIDWILSEYPEIETVPNPSNVAIEYSDYLKDIAQRSLPGFLCHFYNHYFAHTAGGIMIGKKVSDLCLDGKKLNFYEWEGGNVKELLDSVRVNIDSMANSWNREEKDECLNETKNTFKFGGALIQSIAGA